MSARIPETRPESHRDSPTTEAGPPTGPAGARAECLRLLEGLVGAAGVQSFLKIPQPALGDRSGAWLLQHDPEALLGRLEAVEIGL